MIPGGSSTYQWTGWGHGGRDIDQRNVGQDWYRNPRWGGHVVWNPQYGYQDYLALEDIYADAENPLDRRGFNKAFRQAGLKKQKEGSWSTYYGGDPEHPVLSHQQKMMNQYGTPYNPYGAQMQQPQYGGYQQPYGGYQQSYGYQPQQQYGTPAQQGSDPSTWSPAKTATTQPVSTQPVRKPPQQKRKTYTRPRQQSRRSSRRSSWWR